MKSAQRPTLRHRRPVRQPNRFIGPIIILGILALLLQMYWMQQNWGELARRDDHTPLDQELLDEMQGRMITRYECEHCMGNGSITDPDQPGEKKMCPICYGVGYHDTRRYTDADRMCITCGGMGRRYDEHGHAEYCPRCNGRGVVEFGD